MADPPQNKTDTLDVLDLGRMRYTPAYEAQLAHHAEILANRENDAQPLGRILTVEHDPVITVSKRPSAARNLLASEELLAVAGIEVCQTDRGGDITYHGPGQLVVYPIVDLRRLSIKLHEYMRTLEQAVIDTLSDLGIVSHRDTDATGVWIDHADRDAAKVCAMGVRVKRWVTLHGLALNVRTDLSHFDHIVPCGLTGRPVTSIEKEIGGRTPAAADVRSRLVGHLRKLLLAGGVRV